jgi:hypothetical protein
MKARRCSKCGLPGHTAATPHKRRNPAKKGPKQGGFWSSGEDLPLFSGTPQRGDDGKFKPASKARQGSFPGMGVGWEHVRKQQKKRKRNPFAPGKPIRYELKESGNRADTFVIDATQGHYRQHAGTVEGWRKVRGALLSSGVKPDDVWGFGQIRQKEQRAKSQAVRGVKSKSSYVARQLEDTASTIRDYEKDLAKAETQLAGLKGEGSRAKRAEIKELIAWTKRQIADEQARHERHRRAFRALDQAGDRLAGRAATLRTSDTAEHRRISPTEAKRRATNARRKSGRGMTQKMRDEAIHNFRGR